jgi:uncharacterized protein
VTRSGLALVAVLSSFFGAAAAEAPTSSGHPGGAAAGQEPRPTGDPSTLEAPAAPEASRATKLVRRARQEVERRVAYDPSYVRLTFADGRDTGRAVYPGGDLDPGRGVCTDLVVRALRAADVDLQQAIHADILARSAAYRAIIKPDANIDHRRVGPMLTFLRAHATSLPESDWQAGDVVVWAFRPCPACTPDHVGLVSDRVGPSGLPMALHNIGPRPTEGDVLDAWTVLGHFRL